MDTREIVARAKAGTLDDLDIGWEVQTDPLHQQGLSVGDRIAFCTVPWQPGCLVTFAYWRDHLARLGKIVNLWHHRCDSGRPCTTATIVWDDDPVGRYEYIHTNLLTKAGEV